MDLFSYYQIIWFIMRNRLGKSLYKYGPYCLRRSDSILKNFFTTIHCTQKFQMLLTLLFEKILVSNKNEGCLKIEEPILWFLAQNNKN